MKAATLYWWLNGREYRERITHEEGPQRLAELEARRVPAQVIYHSQGAEPPASHYAT